MRENVRNCVGNHVKNKVQSHVRNHLQAHVKDHVKRRMILLTGLLLLVAAPLFCAAANIPVTVDIPVRYIAANPEDAGSGEDTGSTADTAGAAGTADAADSDAGGGGTRILRLTPDTPGAPMPAGTVNGVKELQLQEAGETSFGEITYSRPDIYDYTIDDSGGSTYHVRVIAMNDGQGSMIITREGLDGKTELVFQERLQPPDETERPDAGTSDDTHGPAVEDRQGDPPGASHLPGRVSASSPATGDDAWLSLAALWLLASLGGITAGICRCKKEEATK